MKEYIYAIIAIFFIVIGVITNNTITFISGGLFAVAMQINASVDQIIEAIKESNNFKENK